MPSPPTTLDRLTDLFIIVAIAALTILTCLYLGGIL